MAVKKLLSFRKSGSGSVDVEDLSSVHSSLSSSALGHSVNSYTGSSQSGQMNTVPKQTKDSMSVTDTASDFKSYQYSFRSNSLFSKSGATGSTLISSRKSDLSKSSQKSGNDLGITNVGRLLRVLDEEEEDEPEDTTRQDVNLDQVMQKVDKELKSLLMELNNIILQINQSILNLTKSSIKVNEIIKLLIKNMQTKKLIDKIPKDAITTFNNQSFRKIVKVILYLIDNLLTDEVYTNSRVLVLKSFNDLLIALNLVSSSDPNDLINYNSMLQPKLFTIGATSEAFPNENKIELIINSLLTKLNKILDQDGSFIAPVLRGFYNENISCITFMFGIPELTKEHKEIINVFYSLINDFHFMYQQNSIKLLKTSDFRAPFRIPSNPHQPPISISISSENSTNLSGTLGGYIYPKIDKKIQNKNLLKYQNSVFGVTCAHVVLQDNISNESEYPHVSCPSPVLINLYKRALNNEKYKYKKGSEEYNAYNNVIKQIDEIFPLKDLKLQQQTIQRNISPMKFGQIIWGERIINNSIGRLSDLAIVKMSSDLKCLNYLGDDINFNEYDPSLMFTNLYLKKVVDLGTLQKNSRGLTNGGGLEVFKYGSTTKYTKGNLNGAKMIYWSDGKLKTSEFVIKSNSDKNTSFASGGDSGSWILSKLQDISKYENNFVNTILGEERIETGLGVIGMLHSYDGEFKQFGLFTPMTDILERLYEVTGLNWGVVGCDDGESDDGHSNESLSDLEATNDLENDEHSLSSVE